MSVGIRVNRRERYAPHVEDYLLDLLPTETVVRSNAVRRASIGAGSFVPLASYKVGAGSALRITFLGLFTDTASMWQLRHPGGTVWYYLEPPGRALTGGPDEPIHVIPSGDYFRVGPYGTFGLPAGTSKIYAVSFEGIAVQRRAGYGSAPTP